ncbi:hypothetical protein MMPV_006810 [Pyropia vietnamensis]
MAGHVRRSLTGRSALERPISLGLLAGFACLAFFLLGAVFYGSGSGGGCAGGCLPTGSNAEVAALISQLAARSSGLSSANAAALNGELPAAAARAVAGMATGASPAAPPVRRRRRIVLDVGANSGNSYVELKNNWVGRTIHGNMSDYEVFLMEPNPIFRPYITKLMAAEHAAAGKTFISYLPVAGGTTNGILPFHIDPSMPIAGKFTEEDGYGSGGSSLIAKMPAVDPSNPANPNLRSGVATAGAPAKVVEVESIDLAEWLAREVAIEDEFHLKIDVEGTGRGPDGASSSAAALLTPKRARELTVIAKGGRRGWAVWVGDR